jgi:hypothetical protein
VQNTTATVLFAAIPFLWFMTFVFFKPARACYRCKKRQNKEGVGDTRTAIATGSDESHLNTANVDSGDDRASMASFAWGLTDGEDTPNLASLVNSGRLSIPAMLAEELKAASPPASPTLHSRASIGQMPARDVGKRSPSDSPNLGSRRILVKAPGNFQSSIQRLSPLTTSMRRLKVNTLKMTDNSNNTLNDNNNDSDNDSNTDSNNVSKKNDETTSIYSDFNTEKNVTKEGDVRVFRPNKRSL